MRSGVKMAGVLIVLAGAACGWLGAQPINPQVHKKAYEEAAKTADVVAQVRAVKAVCTALEGEGKVKTVTLQVSLKVLDSTRGPLKKDEVVVVTRKVNLPAGPGPGSYGYMGEIRKFPFVPGVTGQVALNRDKDKRGYVAVAGWVEQPNGNPKAIPTTVGQAIAVDEVPPEKK